MCTGTLWLITGTKAAFASERATLPKSEDGRVADHAEVGQISQYKRVCGPDSQNLLDRFGES
jgi:hypothetical protein